MSNKKKLKLFSLNIKNKEYKYKIININKLFFYNITFKK